MVMTDTIQEDRMSKYKYWQMLSKANADYRSDYKHESIKDELEGFRSWMRDRWGMSIGLETQGYTAHFEVVDPRKYLLFELKYQ
jgi:hypothetical protein